MAHPKKDALASAFKKFDINGDGRISEDELKRVMMVLDPSLNLGELELIFAGADLSKDGAVSMEEFSNWAAEPLGMFGMVPATAAELITPEERAAMRIQSMARGRHARKKVKTAPKKVKQVEPITTAELWEGLAFDSGKMRSKIDVYELVSGFSGCKRTGLASSVELLARDDVQTSEADAFAVGELLLEEVNHLALVICARREPLIETEAKEELLRIKEFVRDCQMAIRSEERMSSRHFKNWTRLLATLMSMDLSVILFQWYWFEFGLFLPTAEVLEVLLMATVYSESRRTALAAKLGTVDSLEGKLVNVPFVLRDLMQLVYNGGLCGRTDCACLMPSEVQALWPYILRHMPHHLKGRRTLRSSVATGTLRKALPHGTALEAPADHSEPRKDLDMEKSHIAGVEEFSILLELLYDDDRMKSRFSSPLEMLVDMVKHAKEYGRLWDDTEAT